MDSLDPGAYKREVAAVFSRTSATHDTIGTPLFATLGSSLVASVELRPGDRVLDVAAGTGATLFPTARRVGPGGRVIAVDLAPGMVQELRARIVAGGVANAAVGVADGEHLPFADGSFDALFCGFALFFFPRPERALGEFRRVLRAGGRLAVSTFAPEGQESFERIRRRIFARLAHPPAREERVAFDRPGQLHEALGRAGFVQVEVDVAPLELVVPDLDALWAWLWSMEFRDYLERMDAEERDAIRRSLADDLAPRGGDAHEIRLRMDALLTRARKPPGDAGT